MSTEPNETPVVVQPQPGSRLEALTALYNAVKDEAKAAAEKLNDLTAAIKAEMASAAPGASRVELQASALKAPLRLTARTGWRLDTKRLKAEQPEMYVSYAVQSTTWELREVAP